MVWKEASFIGWFVLGLVDGLIMDLVESFIDGILLSLTSGSILGFERRRFV